MGVLLLVVARALLLLLRLLLLLSATIDRSIDYCWGLSHGVRGAAGGESTSRSHQHKPFA